MLNVGTVLDHQARENNKENQKNEPDKDGNEVIEEVVAVTEKYLGEAEDGNK